ncbi:hypothetical protein [Porphyrobacter sp. ULC335]|uniref:hypothetical protein n=1 Tax=Porphyrobacter sp. ULC335 TaxID=2854260 RepID=UPI002220B04A|nr:hypothetical protein [Porphyrobacter sp. ULC335]UYV17006.1 hypothetical protein KVF90_06855 [Porphyrobacter sp. ULC335]
MTDCDTTPRAPDEQGTTGEQNDARNRANQDAASRPGVDAEHGLDDRGHMTGTPHEGSTFEPLRKGSDEDRQREANSDYAIDQGAGSASPGGSHGVSRQGAVTQHGDAVRESQSAPGGGSVFQPLEADPRHLEDRDDKQRGNPTGQNQQGLNEGRPGEQIRERRDENEPRGTPPAQDQRRP